MMPLAQHQLSAGATIGRRIAAGAVVAGLGLAIGLPSGVAQDRPAPDPQVLTERFPLDAAETAPAGSGRARDERARGPVPPSRRRRPLPPSRPATPRAAP